MGVILKLDANGVTLQTVALTLEVIHHAQVFPSKTYPISTNVVSCQAYCSQATSCDACFQTHSGCEWCSSDNKCYDSAAVTNITACNPVDFCPDCPVHEYCDTCMDNGCQWCADTLTCASKGSACNTITYTCGMYD